MEQMACAICRRPLDDYHKEGATVWMHPLLGAPYDHEPVPVLMDRLDLVTVCDFCGDPHPDWVYPCGGFVTEVGGLGYGSSDDWAACQTCHRLIEAKYWRQLANRALIRHPEVRGQSRTVLRNEIMRLHEMFVAHRTGEAYPIFKE